MYKYTYWTYMWKYSQLLACLSKKQFLKKVEKKAEDKVSVSKMKFHLETFTADLTSPGKHCTECGVQNYGEFVMHFVYIYSVNLFDFFFI